MMDYKRNRRYFETINWIFIGIIGVIAAILLYFFLLIGIIFVLGLATYIYFKVRDIPTDEEIDDEFNEHVHTVLQKGYGKLGLDPEAVNLMDPIMFRGPLLDPISYDPAVKKGKDEQVRSSNHIVNIFYFMEDRVCFYQQEFSIIDDERNEMIGEYMYKDIMTISTGTKTTMYVDSDKRRDEFFELAFFKLMTVGSTHIEASVQDLKSVQDEISRMKRLIIQKKRV